MDTPTRKKHLDPPGLRRLLLLGAFLALMVVLTPVARIHGRAPGSVEIASADDAHQVASNWVALELSRKNTWGPSPTAEVAGCKEFWGHQRPVGYYCTVEPGGFVVVQRYKAIGMVKAYSTTDRLDLTSYRGLRALIGDRMEEMIAALEAQLGPLESAQTADVETILGTTYTQDWQTYQASAKAFGAQMVAENQIQNYGESDVLLTSTWHQKPPYNAQTPDMSCTWGTCTASNNTNALVGCVCTAGSQIMRYWNWPPYGDDGTPYTDTYDWPHMLDDVTCSADSDEVAAVAELAHECGIAVGMSYGCGFSGAVTADMEGVYETHFRYGTSAYHAHRNAYTASAWYDLMKNEFNHNRPIHYRITEHSIVADGWKDEGTPLKKYYHMNYGWNDSYNTWYELDQLPLGGIDEEYMVLSILPAPAFGGTLVSTVYGPTLGFPYRYFEEDTTGSGASIIGPQSLQFLSGVKVTSSSAAILFTNNSSGQLVLFSRGDEGRGVHISGAGAIKLNHNGSIRLK